MKSFCFSVLIVLLSEDAAAVPVYEDEPCSYSSVIVRFRLSFAPTVPVVPEEVIQSPSRFAAAKVTRTDEVRVPYEDEEAHLEIASAHFPPLYIRVRIFRALEARWVSDRILYIWRDIGHTTSVEELIDVMDRKWLSQKCVADDGKEAQ